MMLRRRLAAACAALALLAPVASSTAGAAEALPTTVTLDQALAYARAHQPRVRAALLRLEVRRQERGLANAQWYPRVGVGIEYMFGTANNNTAMLINAAPAESARIAGTGFNKGTSWGPAANSLAAIRIDQEIYDFGRISAERDVRDALIEVARADAALTGLDITFLVEDAFHGVLAARGVLRAAEDAVTRARTHRDFAAARVKSGLRPPIDLTRAEADLGRLEVARIQASNNLATAQATLAAAIGSEAPALDVSGEGELANSGSPTLEEAARKAGARNPAVARALAALRAQEAEARRTTRALLPDIFAVGSLYGMAGGALPDSGQTVFANGWLPDVGNWYLGVIFRWNVFDRAAWVRRSTAQAETEARKADLEAVRIDVGLEARQATLALETAERALPGLEGALQAARANQAQAEARFQAGLGNIVELADAEAVLTNAEVAVAAGRFEVARARARLARILAQS